MAKELLAVGRIHKPSGPYRTKVMQWVSKGVVWTEMSNYNQEPDHENR